MWYHINRNSLVLDECLFRDGTEWKCLLLPVPPKCHRLKCLPLFCQFCHPAEWKAQSEPFPDRPPLHPETHRARITALTTTTDCATDNWRCEWRMAACTVCSFFYAKQTLQNNIIFKVKVSQRCFPSKIVAGFGQYLLCSIS